MTTQDLLLQIADQAEIVVRCRKAWWENSDPGRDEELARDWNTAEVMLERLLARRRGADETPLFGEE